jgi:CubicO group peptidase (beta-lactamase class C family)
MFGFVRSTTAALAATILMTASASATPTGSKIDAYVRPYVASKNFAGGIVIEKGGSIVYAKNFGFADVPRRIPNSSQTRYHVASLSGQFTMATAMRLIELGKLRPDMKVSEILPWYPNGDKLEIRHLLTETSGLPDINALPDYIEVLKHHQTARSLVNKIVGKPLRFEPGTKYTGEDHSAYNLLALIIETVTGRSFADAVRQYVFVPANMRNSGIDDDSGRGRENRALGYMPVGISGLEAGPPLKWSAKTGNGSAFATVDDEVRWVDAFFGDRIVSAKSRARMLDDSKGHAGYGWFKTESKRFGQKIYYMNGRSPGFASFLVHMPAEDLTVVVLSNIYSSVTTRMGFDLAAIVLGRPYKPMQVKLRTLAPAETRGVAGRFKFGPDFYAPNAVVALEVEKDGLFLRWPDGDRSPMLPMGHDRFRDRTYWVTMELVRGEGGTVRTIRYGRFAGTRQPVE